MKGIRGIVFDKDGTLFDFAATWEVWAAAFLRRIAQDDATAVRLGHAIGFDLLQQKFARDSVVIAGTPGEVADELLAQLEGYTRSQLLNILNQEAAQAPQKEVVPLPPYLANLRSAGLKLGVVTNDAEEPALAHLRAAGVDQAFDFVAGFDSGYGAKPQAGQLLAFCAETGLSPDTVVMVGDSTHDLIAGRRAGMWCVGVLTGLAPREALAPQADHVVQHIGELPTLLG